MFDFSKTIELFNHQTEDRYAANLYVFRDFILGIKEIREVSVKSFLQGIDVDFLIESLNYYIESRSVTSYGGAQKYVSAMKEYMTFLIYTEQINNDKLMTSFGYRTSENKSYRGKVNRYLSSNEMVKESKSKELCTDDEIREFISVCDGIFEQNISDAFKDVVKYHKIRSSIISKLILLSGAVYRVIYEIKLDDLDLIHGTISLNGCTIRLSNKMIDQFKHYINIRNQLTNKENDYLFVDFNGEQLSKITSILGSFLTTYLGRGDVNSLVKYTVINMIRAGITKRVITTFTGVGRDIYEYCEEYVFENMNVSRHLDSKLRGIETFDWV